MSNVKQISAAQRRSAIRGLLAKRQEVAIADLAEQFGVSEMTVRRDLDRLERSGEVRRTHGGAMPSERMVFEFHFLARRQANLAAKRAIAAEALKLVQPGQRIILDTGTTTLELAVLLKDREDLTILTPSLAVASALQFSEGVQVVLLGGVIRRGSPDLTGPVTEAALDMFAADLAFQGADGIDEQGAIYNADMRIGRVDRKIREHARKTYVLADSSKMGKTALTRHGNVCEVAGLITDDRIDPHRIETWQSNGARIIAVAVRNRNHKGEKGS